MQRLKTFILFMALMILSSICTPCRAAPQTMDYEVYAGGINALSATLDLDASSAGPYHIKLQAQTKGLLGQLAPWHGMFATDGKMKAGVFRPALYQSTSAWHKKDENKQFRYNPDGSFAGFQIIATGKDGTQKDATANDVDPALTRDTTDSLSATLAVMRQVGGGGNCDGTADVFDGMRRFKLVFHPEGIDTIAPSNLNVYSGPAQRCTVEVIPVAGEWHKKPRGWLSIQEQGRQKGSLPTLWLAKIGDSDVAVPIRIRVTTDYGVLFLQLASYDGSGQHKVASNANPPAVK